jgi:hypothetical protein
MNQTTEKPQVGTSAYCLDYFRLCYRAHQSDWSMYLSSISWGDDAEVVTFWANSARFYRKEGREWAVLYRLALMREREVKA